MQDAKTDTFTLWAYWHGSQTVRHAWYKYKCKYETLVCVLKRLSGHLTDMIQILESIAWVYLHTQLCTGVCLYRYGSPDGQSDMHDILCHPVFKIPIKIKIQIHSYAKKKWYTFLFYSIEWLPIALIKSWLLSVWPRCKYLPYFSGYYFLRSRHPSPSFYPALTSVNPPVQPLCISASSAMQLWCRKMYILKQNANPPEKNLHFCFRANCPGTFFTTLAFFETL